MTAHLDLDETGTPLSITDVAGRNRRLTAWGVIDVGPAAALILTDGTPPTAGQAQAIAGHLDPDRADLQAKLRLARDGQLTAIEHATTWEAEARAARRSTPAPAAEPATVEIALPWSGATALSAARGRVDWVDLDQPTGPPADLGAPVGVLGDLVDERPPTRWVDVLALLLLAVLGVAGIVASVAWDSLVVGIFGGCLAGAAVGLAVADR